MIDNNLFVLGTNVESIATKGWCKHMALFNSNHKAALHLTDTDNSKIKHLPYANHLYNQKMNGVDVLDQYVS